MAGGLGCQPDDTGGETQEGGQLIFKAFTTVYGNMVPSMYWYNSGDVRLHSYAYWDEFNVTKTYEEFCYFHSLDLFVIKLFLCSG